MNSINMDISSKCGEIFRKDNGVYEFICFHCAEQFESINQIISHIDSHFYDDSANYLTTIIKEEPNIKFEECTIIEHLNLKEDDDDDDDDINLPYELVIDFDTRQETNEDHSSSNGNKQVKKKIKRSKMKRIRHAEDNSQDIDRFFCDICNYSSYYFSQMRMHMETHSNLKLYKCTMCPRSYNQSKNLINHKRDFHGAKRTCQTCGKQFKYKVSLNRHQKYYCNTSNAIPQQEDIRIPISTKNDHIISTTNDILLDTKEFTCDICTYSCHFLFEMKMHMEATHFDLNVYKCKMCPRTFSEEQYRNNHEREFHGEKVSCACGKKFQFKSSLIKHHKNHCQAHVDAMELKLANQPKSDANNDKKKFECDICYTKFWCIARLKKHQAKHTDLIETCEICGKKYQNQSQLMEHAKKVHGFKCNLCEEILLSQQLLEDHFAENHGMTKQEVLQYAVKKAVLATDKKEKKLPDIISYTCKECNFNTAPLASMDEHIKIHTNVYTLQCLICKKLHKNPSSLKYHMRIHTVIPEKPFRCEVCHRSFRFLRYLSEHMTVHTDEKKFSCNLCDKKFRQHTELTMHTRIHLNKRDFQCYVCGRCFLSSGHLKYHIKDHTDGPFYCPHCNKEYSTRKSLRSHLISHTDARPYQCKQCGKDFKAYGVLRRHEEIHSTEKKYKCRMCDMAFTVSRSRAAHERNKHQLLTSK